MSARIYSVCITITTLVQADNKVRAAQVARDSFRDIAGDTLPQDITVGVMAEITALTGLPDGWDSHCLPYGGDGATQLHKLLPERAA